MGGLDPPATRGWYPNRWLLWAQPAHKVGYFLLVDFATVLIVVVMSGRAISTTEFRLFATLAVLGVLAAELSRRTERARRHLAGRTYINMASVWTFAGLLVLPAALIAALVGVLYAHLALRSWQGLRRAPAHRTVCNACRATLTCLAAWTVLNAAGYHGIAAAEQHHLVGFLPVIAALAVDFVAGALLPMPLADRRSIVALLGSWSDNLLELATLCLGVATAALLYVLPELAIAMLPPMLLIERSMLVQELEVAASTDEKTGTLNLTRWRAVAERELARASRDGNAAMGVMMVDLDHFKQVNDARGHLAGDAVLRAIADTITGTLRRYDTLGRFGGEEFVVLLPDTTANAALQVAERVRQAVGEVEVAVAASDDGGSIADLSASIGIGMFPADGTTLDGLLNVADTALYQAKRGGRNRVATAASASSSNGRLRSV